VNRRSVNLRSFLHHFLAVFPYSMPSSQWWPGLNPRNNSYLFIFVVFVPRLFFCTLNLTYTHAACCMFICLIRVYLWFRTPFPWITHVRSGHNYFFSFLPLHYDIGHSSRANLYSRYQATFSFVFGLWVACIHLFEPILLTMPKPILDRAVY
jgi:hypothetical protein